MIPVTDSTVDALIVDFLLWLATRERSYEEALDAWRTSCPKLTVWEDANDRKLIAIQHAGGREVVRITPAGFAFLEERRTFCKNPGNLEGSRPA